MKKFVYAILKKETGELVALYSDKALAKKLMPVIGGELEVELELKKTQVDADIKSFLK